MSTIYKADILEIMNIIAASFDGTSKEDLYIHIDKHMKNLLQLIEHKNVEFLEEELEYARIETRDEELGKRFSFYLRDTLDDNDIMNEVV